MLELHIRAWNARAIELPKEFFENSSDVKTAVGNLGDSGAKLGDTLEYGSRITEADKTNDRK